jgi:hypothetical protein
VLLVLLVLLLLLLISLWRSFSILCGGRGRFRRR